MLQSNIEEMKAVDGALPRPLRGKKDSGMNRSQKAERIVRDMERDTPYMYEGLYGNFLKHFMGYDKSKWTTDLSKYLSDANQDWEDIGNEIAAVLWDRFEKRISC